MAGVGIDASVATPRPSVAASPARSDRADEDSPRRAGRGNGRGANPFAVSAVEPGAIPWFVQPGMPDAADVLDAAEAGAGGVILGPHGTGKSTLLRHVQALAAARGRRVVWWRAEPIWRRAAARPAWADVDLLLVDSAERMGGLRWWLLRLRARAAGVPVVGTAHRPGRGRTLARRTIDVELLRAVVERLLDGTGAQPPADDDLRRRLDRRRGDLRQVLWDLYDAWERREPAGPGWAEADAPTAHSGRAGVR